MASVVIVGSQWGDEGKGKMTDYLSQEADVVVRSQGATMPAIPLALMARNLLCA